MKYSDYVLHGLILGVLAFTMPTAPAIDYERDIAPILRSYCAGCHNEREWEGEFSLETYAGLREGGDKGDPIRPQDPENSYLTKVLEGRSKPNMPPPDEPRLADGDLDKLKEWIAQGAKGPEIDRSLFSHLVVPELPASKAAPPVTAIAYSPDGSHRATGRFGKVEVMATASNSVLRTLEGLPGKINALHFSPDGRELLVATGITGLKGVASLWDLESGERLAEYDGHEDVLYDAEISPDGRWIATAGYDSTIRIWDKQKGSHVRTLTAHQGAVFDLAFHPNSSILASASADETVKLWRIADGVRLDTLSQPQGEQMSVHFTPDGDHVVSAGADKRLHCWRLVSREEPALNPLLHSRFAHEASITSLLCLADGRHLVSAAADRSLKVWSFPELLEVHAYDPLPDIVAALSEIPQKGEFSAARMDGTTQTYRLTASRSALLGETVITSAPATLTSSPPAVEPSKIEEEEPNDTPKTAMLVSLPGEIHGRITEPGDEDLYRFHAQAGQSLFLAVDAARSGALLDSKIEVLDTKGEPIEQVRLQATRDSWLTFRGKDSDTSDDFRVHNWAQMELNEYLYANGEVVRLWLYPRGPDSGFKVYPGTGKRHTSFFTTALSHPLGAPCYIVEPLPAGQEAVPNGLPVFPVYWENDDDPLRRWGADSQLWFDVPADGEYLLKLTDVRSFGGEDYHYRLTMRDRRPDFNINVSGEDPSISPGSGREVVFTVERHEGFSGEVEIAMENLPPGFTASSPVVIQAGQQNAIGVIRADASAKDPDEEADGAVRVTATARIGGKEVNKSLGTLGNIQLGDPAKVTVEILALNAAAEPRESGQALEFRIRPGTTISARVVATRHDFEGRIELGGDDSGRNLPHGLYVDNIGLNGLLIVEGQSEREFFITAAPWVPSGKRLFHLRATADGGQASAPAIIHVVGDEELQ